MNRVKDLFLEVLGVHESKQEKKKNKKKKQNKKKQQQQQQQQKEKNATITKLSSPPQKHQIWSHKCYLPRIVKYQKTVKCILSA